MTDPTAADARLAVLHEYRRRRHAHRPYLAMRAIADGHACSYMYGLVLGLAADEPSQVTDFEHFKAADAYAVKIFHRGNRTNHGFWLCGTCHHTDSATS